MVSWHSFLYALVRLILDEPDALFFQLYIPVFLDAHPVISRCTSREV